MRIRNIEIAEDLETILEKLKVDLSNNGLNYFQTIRPTGTENVMVSCPYHKGGQERKPSAGIKRDTGILHCFTCDETHPLDEVISYCFGRNDSGMYGWNWLAKNFLFLETEEGEKRDVRINFERTRNTSLILSRNNNIGNNSNHSNNNDNMVEEYVTEEELDSYRYIHPYLEKRGIVDEEIIELFDIGYSKVDHCITFPVRDIYGNCLFVAKRNVNTKFFRYPSGTQKPLYGLYELELTNPDWNKGYPDIFVCESMIDCILLWQAGHYAVALNGLGNQLQFQQLRDLPCRHLILATDNDEAGMKARDRIKQNVKNKLFSEILFPVGIKDIGECTREQIENIKDWEEII